MPLDSFYRHKNYKDGHKTQCKSCENIANSERQKQNPEKTKVYQDRYKIKHKPLLLTKAKKYYELNTEKCLNSSKKWREENPVKNKASYENWRINNPHKVRDYNQSPKIRLGAAIRSAINKSLKVGEKARRSTFSFIGYTKQELMDHLESKFQDGMSWENYGKDGWHVDHIKPLKLHYYETIEDEDFQKAWALSNLQPLWQFDNLKKSSKYDFDENNA